MESGCADGTGKEQAGQGVIYFAGGCFWGMQKFMDAIPGVLKTTCGYANGALKNPTYAQVCGGNTGARETVRVVYDPHKVSLDALVYAFFSVIDPTQANRQGPDVGSQYQTGIYYADAESGKTARRIAAVEARRSSKFEVEIKPLTSFYDAEEEHQDYLSKHPGGYCHIPSGAVRRAQKLAVDPVSYQRPSDETLRSMLSSQSFDVTQRRGTEPPGSSEFWQNERDGIYVDVVTGEPLFASCDKYESSCGWPAFCKPIDGNVVREGVDVSHGMVRTEVTSRVGVSHLGHVFEGDSESPNGVRYCINGAALRFIAYDMMDAEGYGNLKDCVKRGRN